MTNKGFVFNGASADKAGSISFFNNSDSGIISASNFFKFKFFEFH